MPSALEAIKRCGIMIGGIVILVGVISGAQFLIGHRIPDWLEAIVMVLVALGVYALYVRFTDRRPVDELAPAAFLSQSLCGLAIGVGLFVAVIGLLALTDNYHYFGYAWVPGLLAAFMTTLPGAVIEELLLRGFLFRVVESIGGTWIGVAVSAIVFGALHAFNPHATVVSSVAIALEAGVLLAIAYAATRGLWLPIGLHIGWNFTEGHIFGISVSGRSTLPGLFRGTVTGPDILTGGSFGIEASILAVFVCFVVASLLIAYTLRAGRIVRHKRRL